MSCVFRWETKQRYYSATTYRDLLGDIVVAVAHGGRHNNLGQLRVHPVDTWQAAGAALDAIATKRARRGYLRA